MAELRAADVQYVLNSIPYSDYQTAYGLDTKFIDRLGGFKPGPGRIQIPFRYAGNSAKGSFGEGDDISAAGHQSRRMLSMDYKRVYITFGVDGLQEAIAKAGGIVNITDLVVDEALNAIQDLLDEINTQLLGDGSGNSGKHIDGILYHIDDDNTWMGLSRASYSWTQSYISGNGGTSQSLTKALLRGVSDTLKDVRKSNYTAIYTSTALRNAYEDLLEDAKRYVDIRVGDLVVQELAFDGKPLIAFPGYASNRLDFVRESDFDIYFLPQTSQDQLGRTVTGIFKVEPVAKVSDDATFNVIAYLNMVCRNPWKQGALVDVE